MDDFEFEKMLSEANITEAQRDDLRALRAAQLLELEAKRDELDRLAQDLKNMKIEALSLASQGISNKRLVELALKGENE